MRLNVSVMLLDKSEKVKKYVDLRLSGDITFVIIPLFLYFIAIDIDKIIYYKITLIVIKNS